MTHSVRSLIQTLRTQLAAVSSNAELETRWLIEHVAGIREHVLLNQELEITASQRLTLQHLAEKRASGLPLAYVLEQQPFWTLTLKVSPAVLIPRAETELVVARALHHLAPNTSANVLDLGTGSGAIALAVALERPRAQVWASDESINALALARDNAKANHLGNLIFQRSDWFTDLAPQRFDLILSNPPYIAEGDPDLEPAVLAHEPRSALIAGADGLSALRKIITAAPQFLAPGGWLVLEHGWRQAAQVRQLLESAGMTSVASHADLAGHLRVTEAQAV